jgi:O-antigen biosynthesis protein
MSTTPCLALFSPIDYDFIYQRPQALADALAQRGVHVMYFEPPRRAGSLNNSRLRYGAAHLVRSVGPNLSIIPVSRYFDFLGVPFRFSRPTMKRHIRGWIAAALKELCPTGVTALVETPTWWEYLQPQAFGRILYDCIDHSAVLCGKTNAGVFEGWRSDLIEHSDVVFATAAELAESLAAEHPTKTVLRLPNAAFSERFASATPMASVMALRRRFTSIAGYVGVFAAWTDIALIESCADRCPDTAFVLVGPGPDHLLAGLKQRPNVFLVGRQPHADIPSYIHSFDVCLSPFIDGGIAASTNPVKIYEYLAAGKPVVSTPIRELGSFADLVYSAASADEFVAALRRVTTEGDQPHLVEQRRAFASVNSWAHRADVIIENLGGA